MTCFVRWAQRFLIVRLLSSAWARVRSRKLQFRYSLHGCGGRGLLSDLTLLVAIEQYRAHRIFVRVNCKLSDLGRVTVQKFQRFLHLPRFVARASCVPCVQSV